MPRFQLNPGFCSTHSLETDFKRGLLYQQYIKEDVLKDEILHKTYF